MIKRLLSLVFVSAIVIYWLQQRSSSSWEAPDLAGIWKMENDAWIELRNDGTCRIVKFELSKFVASKENQDQRISLSGKWDYKGYFREVHAPHPSDKLWLEVRDPRQEITFFLAFSVPLSYLSGEKRPSRIYLYTSGKERCEFRRLN